MSVRLGRVKVDHVTQFLDDTECDDTEYDDTGERDVTGHRLQNSR